MDKLTEEEKKWVYGEMASAIKANVSGEWRQALDPKSNKPYYFNKLTKLTTWKLPELFHDDEARLIGEVMKKRKESMAPTSAAEVLENKDNKPQQQNVAATQRQPAFLSSNEKAVNHSNGDKVASAASASQSASTFSHKHRAEKVDQMDEVAVEGEEQVLLDLLSQKDSILEPNVIKNAQKLIRVYKQGPKQIIERLSGSYVGYPQLCSILLDVLSYTESIDTSDKSKSQSSSMNSEQISLDHFNGLIKQRFNKKQADEILLKCSHTPSWLKDMIHNDHTREVLSDLISKHRDSAFLRICSKEMNNLGYGNKHSPLLIATDLDNVNKFYLLFIDLVLKSLRDESKESYGVGEELSLLCRADKSISDLCRYECKRLTNIIYNKAPQLAWDDEAEPSAKRVKTEDSSFFNSDRLQRLLKNIQQLLTSSTEQRNSVQKRGLDVAAMKTRVQSDSLLQALVNVVEMGSVAASDFPVVLSRLGANSSNGPQNSLFINNFYWCSKPLTNILLDTFLSSPSHSLSTAIATASMISDYLPHMSEIVSSMNSIPANYHEMLEALGLNFTFIRWKESMVEDIAATLPKIETMCKDLGSMTYGTTDKEHTDSLTALIKEQRVYAQLLLRIIPSLFAQNSSKDMEQSINAGGVVSVWAKMLRTIVSTYPVLNQDTLQCVEVLLDFTSKSTESDDLAIQSAKLLNVAEAKKDLLLVLVDIMKADFAVEEAGHYLMAHFEGFDAVTVREVLHSLLVDLQAPYWKRHKGVFVDLLSMASVSRAISNIHFKRDAMENLRSLLVSMSPEEMKEFSKAKYLLQIVVSSL